VTVIDSELIFADALAIRLEAEEDIAVVAVARAASSAVLSRPADVVLLDIGLAAGTANRLRAGHRGRESKVVVLGSAAAPPQIAMSVLGVACAWVGKDDSVEHLLTVLRMVAAGGTWWPATEPASVPARPLRPAPCEHGGTGPSVMLTPRERQVLDCLAEGAGRSEVAQRLHMSANTVRTHVQNLMRKLGVHSCVEAAAVARRARGPVSQGPTGGPASARGRPAPTSIEGVACVRLCTEFIQGSARCNVLAVIA
jgi:two-component system NarL family response regulator